MEAAIQLAGHQQEVAIGLDHPRIRLLVAGPEFRQRAYGPPGAPPAYGAAPAYAAYPQGPKTNTLAIVSLVSSLVGVFVIPVIGQIVGIITGHMSLNQIKRTGENGRGLGLAGVIIGWVSLGLAIVGIILFIAWFGVIFANARYSS